MPKWVLEFWNRMCHSCPTILAKKAASQMKRQARCTWPTMSGVIDIMLKTQTSRLRNVDCVVPPGDGKMIPKIICSLLFSPHRLWMLKGFGARTERLRYLSLAYGIKRIRYKFRKWYKRAERNGRDIPVLCKRKAVMITSESHLCRRLWAQQSIWGTTVCSKPHSYFWIYVKLQS